MTAQHAQRVLAIMIVAPAVIGAVTAMIALGVLSSSRSFQSHGTVKAVNIGVYWDSSCVDAVSTIDWGMLSPGDSKNVTVYVQNSGNVALTLSLAVENWVPVNASDYMGLVWDREGQTIEAGSVVAAVLTLSVSPSISGITDFGLDITLTGAE